MAGAEGGRRDALSGPQLAAGLRRCQATPSFTGQWYSYAVGSAYTYDVVGRQFDATGVAESGEIVLNQDSTANVESPVGAALDNGLIVTAWQATRAPARSGSAFPGRT